MESHIDVKTVEPKSSKCKYAFFDLDGIVADDSLKLALKVLTGNDTTFFTPDVLDKIAANEQVISIIKNKHDQDYNITILADRNRDLDIVTTCWLDRILPFKVDIQFRPGLVKEQDYPTFKVGLIIGFVELFKITSFDIFTNNKVFVSLLLEQLKKLTIYYHIYLIEQNEITIMR